MADVLVRGQSLDGSIRVFSAVTTELCRRAQQIHQSLPPATAALGRLLTAGAMMGRMAGMVMYLARAKAPAPSSVALS